MIHLGEVNLAQAVFLRPGRMLGSPAETGEAAGGGPAVPMKGVWGHMVGSAAEALARVVRDPASRLVAVGVALALTLSGVTRAFLEMASWGVGTFPMPGDNLLMLACTGALCAAMCWAHGALAQALRSRAGRVVVCVFALIGVGLLDACHFLQGEAATGLLFFAGALVRVSGLVALVALCACDGPRPICDVVAQMAWAVCLAVVLDWMFLLLAPAGVAVVGLLVPVALGAVLLNPGLAGENSRTRRGQAASSKAGTPACQPTCAAAVAQTGDSRLPWARLATFCLYGVVGGLASSQAFTLGSASLGQEPSLAQSCLLNDLGLLLGCALLLLGTLALERRGGEPFALRYLLLPAYLVAIFLSPLLSGMFGLLVPALMAVSQALFYGLLWAFPAPARQGQRLRWFATGCGFFFVGTYAGMFLGGDVLRAMDAGDVFMVAAALALAALLAVELAPRLFTPHAQAGDAQAGGIQPDQPSQPAQPSEPVRETALGIDALAELAGDAWGLTPRERAVLPGLLRGRSVAWVAQSLTVSKNTVHTHVRNIYQKADVHSQEELIDAAEGLGGRG